MKVRILLALSLLVTCSVRAQQMRDVFKSMPDSIMPYLSSNNRLDFIDFMDSNMKAEVHNLLGGTSEMTALTDDSLSIRMSEALRVDMLLLPVEEVIDSSRTVVCVSQTFGTDSMGFDSRQDFYTIRWRKLGPLPSFPIAEQRRIKTLEVQTILKKEDEILKKN